MQADLRSDTVTCPTPPMLETMMQAEVGDDVHGSDPSVNALEAKAAQLFGMEAAVFCPSGTMTNQAAIRVHTEPGEEVVCDRSAHIYNFEGGGMAVHSGVSVFPLNGNHGRFTPEQLEEAIRPDNEHSPRTSLVSIENTCNKGGGSYYTLQEMESLSKKIKTHKLRFHLDGARIFNALVELDVKPAQLGPLFDTISICLSKGLGAPVGSLLLGSKDFIQKARRVRKVMGGGMRQAGYLAAAGSYALDHHVERLKDDHRRACKLAEALQTCGWVENILPVHTNIVVVTIDDDMQPDETVKRLEDKGVRAVPFGRQQIRFVTHLDINDEQLDYAIQVCQNLKP